MQQTYRRGEWQQTSTLWDFGVHWDFANSLKPWKFMPEKDLSHRLSECHQCSGSASLGSKCLGSFSSSRELRCHPEHTSFGVPRPALWSGHQGSLQTVAETRQLWPVCFLGSTCAALQALEELCSGERAGSKISATSHHFMGWASHIHSSQGQRKSTEWEQAECHPISRATSLKLPATRLTALVWDSWGPVLVCSAAVLYPTFFSVPLSFCKDHESCGMGAASLWAPSGRDALGRCQETALTRADGATLFPWELWGGRGNQRVAPS